MRIYSSPRRGYCASCELVLTGPPVYYMDETYCCTGCAHGGPCICTYDADVAEDGVSGLGLPFAPSEPVVEPWSRTEAPAGHELPLRR
jgi:hypothetical protein